MSNEKATRAANPLILARARELRRPMTPSERRLWRRLRRKQLFGIKFRRQHPMWRFILDFFCYDHKLVVEVDGSHHARPDHRAYDQARTEWLESRGLRVIRFTNRQVNRNLQGVLYEIARACGVDADESLGDRLPGQISET